MFYFYLREHNICDRIFFLFTNSSIFLFFLACHLKCLILAPCITKRNHVWKYHLIFFFCSFKTFFFYFGGALRKELLYKRSRTTTHWITPDGCVFLKQQKLSRHVNSKIYDSPNPWLCKLWIEKKKVNSGHKFHFIEIKTNFFRTNFVSIATLP